MNYKSLTNVIQNMNEQIKLMFNEKGLRIVEDGIELALIQGNIQKILYKVSNEKIMYELFEQLLHSTYCVKYTKKAREQILRNLYFDFGDYDLVKGIIEFCFWINKPRVNSYSFEFTEIFLHNVNDQNINKWEDTRNNVLKVYDLLVRTRSEELREVFRYKEKKHSLEYIDPIALKLFTTFYDEYENICKEMNTIIKNTIKRIIELNSKQ